MIVFLTLRLQSKIILFWLEAIFRWNPPVRWQGGVPGRIRPPLLLHPLLPRSAFSPSRVFDFLQPFIMRTRFAWFPF